eukprot:730774-Amphidinium_carterae.1
MGLGLQMEWHMLLLAAVEGRQKDLSSGRREKRLLPFTAMAAKQSTKKRLRDMDSDDQVDWYNRQAEVVQNRGMAKRLCAL